MPSVLSLESRTFIIFVPIRCFINSYMEEVQVGVIYNILSEPNQGDLAPYALQTIYFSNINENKISDRETPVEMLSFEPQYGTDPLLLSSISIVRHLISQGKNLAWDGRKLKSRTRKNVF